MCRPRISPRCSRTTRHRPLAAAGYANGNYDGSGQEFLVRRAVPEPATILLMLTGLVMLVGVNRKRMLAISDL